DRGARGGAGRKLGDPLAAQPQGRRHGVLAVPRQAVLDTLLEIVELPIHARGRHRHGIGLVRDPVVIAIEIAVSVPGHYIAPSATVEKVMDLITLIVAAFAFGEPVGPSSLRAHIAWFLVFLGLPV